MAMVNYFIFVLTLVLVSNELASAATDAPSQLTLHQEQVHSR